ncbi:aminoglycoside phosphotransferase family protein [Marinobacterium weihaiense]|uniref:Phosphotransferase n=1 Tax=Marinobacterium weihaiense TaxID=2851016 RepID=A0ABS6MA49_9GAMM|nr:phosphotransferase [Marinobacterium weihaiense]MBV0933045.1 phosphotransferase [Marinobacterium weihaiense]
MGQRLKQLSQWVQQQASDQDMQVSAELEPVSGDASFRRYFRARGEAGSWIAVDAPPAHEDCEPFIAIAQGWLSQGVPVPRVIASDLEQGFMLLDDFGDQLLLPALDDGSAERHYAQAFELLRQIQRTTNPQLPPYDQVMLAREMALFPEWFLTRLLGLELSDEEYRLNGLVARLLIESALAQPRVSVHRDYHSRNLMLLEDGSLGVIDFQDAVQGPVTYDLVSLLRDCYIDWPDEQVGFWVEAFRQRLGKDGVDVAEAGLFRQQFDLMGMQRHLKVLGIFSRLSLRDGKDGYLDDLPRTLAYVYRASARYEELDTFTRWLEKRVIPALQAHPHFAQQSLAHWWH